MFLKEKQKNLNDDSDLLTNSQILKIGHKVLDRTMSNTSSLPATPNESQEDIGVKTVKSSFIFQVGIINFKYSLEKITFE